MAKALDPKIRIEVYLTPLENQEFRYHVELEGGTKSTWARTLIVQETHRLRLKHEQMGLGTTRPAEPIPSVLIPPRPVAIEEVEPEIPIRLAITAEERQELTKLSRPLSPLEKLVQPTSLEDDEDEFDKADKN